MSTAGQPQRFPAYDAPASVYRARIAQRQTRAKLLEQWSTVDDLAFRHLLAEWLLEDPGLAEWFSLTLHARIAVREYMEGKA